MKEPATATVDSRETEKPSFTGPSLLERLLGPRLHSHAYPHARPHRCMLVYPSATQEPTRVRSHMHGLTCVFFHEHPQPPKPIHTCAGSHLSTHHAQTSVSWRRGSAPIPSLPRPPKMREGRSERVAVEGLKSMHSEKEDCLPLQAPGQISK